MGKIKGRVNAPGLHLIWNRINRAYRDREMITGQDFKVEKLELFRRSVTARYRKELVDRWLVQEGIVTPVVKKEGGWVSKGVKFGE